MARKHIAEKDFAEVELTLVNTHFGGILAENFANLTDLTLI